MIIHILDLFGTGVFAVTGAIAAGRKRMDVFGIVVVAIVTAIGGGTLRDLVLGIRPVSWVSSPVYVSVAILAALATFVTARYVRLVWPVLLVFDAVGLAVFTVIGCQKAMALQVSSMIVVAMGVMTGVAGGVIRDMLMGEIPLILRKEIYATASLVGGVVFVALSCCGIGSTLGVVVAMVVVLAVRLTAIYFHLALPVLAVPEGEESVNPSC